MILKRIKNLATGGEMSQETVEAELQLLIAGVQEVLGREFRMLALFGSLARGDFKPGGSDINLLLIADRLDMENLKKIHGLINASKIQHWLSPLMLTPEELPPFARVFPVKVMEIKSCYRLLAGEDLLKNLSFEKKFLRWRTEQELRNILTKMRRAVIGGLPYQIFSNFSRFLAYYLSTLKSLTYLEDSELQEARGRKALDLLNIDETQLEQLIGVKKKHFHELSPAEIEAACALFMTMLEQSLLQIEARAEGD